MCFPVYCLSSLVAEARLAGRGYTCQPEVLNPLMLAVPGLFQCTYSTDDSCDKIRLIGAKKNHLESQEESKNRYDTKPSLFIFNKQKIEKG